MRIVHISDTHGKHRDLVLPPGDVLVHSGDFCELGIDVEINAFLNWIDRQSYKHIVLISGNHDSDLAECEGFVDLQFEFGRVHYLCNDSIVIDGVKFYGSPYTPSEFGDSFTYYPEDADWSNIPNDTDVLVTHGPPRDILDDGQGCSALKTRVAELNLKAHLFGHIHQSKGMKKKGNTFYSNAAESIHVLEL